jgi:hypothetical protein
MLTRTCVRSLRHAVFSVDRKLKLLGAFNCAFSGALAVARRSLRAPRA